MFIGILTMLWLHQLLAGGSHQAADKQQRYVEHDAHPCQSPLSTDMYRVLIRPKISVLHAVTNTTRTSNG
jgi:hypothetical protein